MAEVIAATHVALGHMITPEAFFFLFFGSILGLIFGALPGVGPVAVISLLIPFSWGMNPMTAFTLFGAAGGASCSFGGSIPSILLNTPGTAPNISTTLDGYPMTVKGKASVAVAASASSSVLGGLWGLLILIALIPVVRTILVSFGPPEFFLLAVLGISMIAFLTEGNVIRSLFAGAFGLALAFVGLDPITGTLRYTFGSIYLWDGIPHVPVLMGIFAVSEAFRLGLRGYKPVAGVEVRQSFSDVMEGVIAPFKHLRLLLQSSTIGTIIGMMPGVGAVQGGMLAWIAGSATVRKDVKFGTGQIEGVIASEAAICAKDGGALLPTIAFGIPGSAEHAVLLGAFILHGIQPGPRILSEQLPIVMILLLALLFSTIIVTAIGIGTAKYLARISTIPGNIIAPIIVVLCVIGSYAIRNSMLDSLILLIMGILGYFMIRFGFSRITFALGLILGHIAEINFGISLQISETGALVFFTQPISLGLIALIVIVILFSVVMPRLKKRGTGW
jgi:putative tricarboxylic transport membrane protein